MQVTNKKLIKKSVIEFGKLMREHEEGSLSAEAAYDKIAFIILCQSAGVNAITDDELTDELADELLNG